MACCPSMLATVCRRELLGQHLSMHQSDNQFCMFRHMASLHKIFRLTANYSSCFFPAIPAESITLWRLFFIQTQCAGLFWQELLVLLLLKAVHVCVHQIHIYKVIPHNSAFSSIKVAINTLNYTKSVINLEVSAVLQSCVDYDYEYTKSKPV